MMKQKGGKVIASGGFGCIFTPSLKCVNGERKQNDITKLMTIKHSNDEYNQIEAFNNILKHIPDYQKYFLLEGVSICEPDKLTEEDLNQFDEKCSALKKINIKSTNINNKLDKLLAVNMPYGGVDVSKYIETNINGYQIIELNNSLINLLKEGIVPMNNLDCIHGDIKDGNILVNFENEKLQTRLIDWGLAFKHKKITNEISRKIYRRPFQFNVPFSVIIFNKEFTERYENFLIVNPEPTFFKIREFVMNYIFVWIDIRGAGHFKTINSIMNKLIGNELPLVKKKSKIIEYDLTHYYIIEYITRVLEKYTVNNKFMFDDYFNNVFLKIVDIWGFIMVYIALYEELFENYDTLYESQMQFIDHIKYIIIHFLFENPTTTIDITELVNELTKLNTFCEQFNTKMPSKKLNYLRSLTKKQKSNNKKQTKKNNKNNNKKNNNKKNKKSSN